MPTYPGESDNVEAVVQKRRALNFFGPENMSITSITSSLTITPINCAEASFLEVMHGLVSPVPLRSPGDCLLDLWNDAERRLFEASQFEPEFLRTRPEWRPKGVVSYCAPRQGARDPGDYRWADGNPSIRIFREGALPIPDHRPDLQTKPDEDAILLAHELGHLMFDRECAQTREARERMGLGAISSADEAAILEEESEAWRIGRDLLAEQGCEQWELFEQLRTTWFGSYVSGLRGIVRASAP